MIILIMYKMLLNLLYINIIKFTKKMDKDIYLFIRCIINILLFNSITDI